MSEFKNTSIQVTTFINPHLFWFFLDADAKKRDKVIQELQKNICDPTIIRHVHIGQAVLVYDKIWKRAVVKEITDSFYTCWLLDYGVLYDYDTLYKLPDEHANQPTVIKQGALNGVVNVQKTLQVGGIVLNHTIKFFPGIVKCAKECLAKAQTIFFDCVTEQTGLIHLGSVAILKPGGHIYDLACALADKGMLAFNENKFQEALAENLNSEDSEFLALIRSDIPCPGLRKNPMESVQQIVKDIAGSKGLGRGVARSPRVKEAELTPGTKLLVEDWLKDSPKTSTPNQLSFESDDSESISSPSVSADSSVTASSTPKALSSQALVQKNSTRMLSDSNPVENKISSSSSNNTSISTINSETSIVTEISAHDILTNFLQGPALNISSTDDDTMSENKASPSSKLQSLGVSSPDLASPKHQTNDWSDLSDGKINQSALNAIPAGTFSALTNKKTKPKDPFAKQLGPKEKLKDSPSSQNSSTSSQKPNEQERDSSFSQNVMKILKQHCTQGCNCEQCKAWDSDGLGTLESKEFLDTKRKKKKLIVKPSLLLKTDDNKNDVIELKSHTTVMAQSTKIECSIAPKIVVHGHTIPPPITSINSVPFHAYIHRLLRSFEQVYTVQSFAWPCIMRHTSICMVNGPKSGKTMAYLPPLSSFLLELQERYGDLPSNTISPIAIILCPGTEVASNVQNLLHKLVDRAVNKPTCALAIPPVDKRCLNQFQRQCDVLITTPLTLISLLHTRIITMKRLCHLVIESADRILDKFSKEIDSLLNLIQNMLGHRSCNVGTQVIITAEHWTVPLETLLKRLNIPPVVCVGSYLEAALYGRVDIQMHFLDSKKKRHHLVELLKDSYKSCKTVIICNSDSEIDAAKEYLNTSSINTLFMYDTMDEQEITDMELKWKCTAHGRHLVLLCTDRIFNNSLNITKAVQLVHYSLPGSWTQFANRFNCLLDNYISPLSTKQPDNWVRCKVHVFIDESCSKQFPKLFQLLQRMGAKLSPKFVEYYKQMVKTREEEKLASKTKLCPNLKLFGRCSSDNRVLYQSTTVSEVFYSSLNCKNRHIVSVESDYSSGLPTCGFIKFKIVHIQDVTTFTVKILEHTDLMGKTHKRKTYDNLQGDLQEAMHEQEVSIFDAKIDGWYVLYSEKDKQYYRCTVQRILEVEKITNMASSVRVRCLDSGIKKDVPCSSLFELPKRFRCIPAQGVDVIIANMLPPDFDESWSAGSKSKVRYMLHEAGYQDEAVYGMGQILLQLENSIWVKNILIRERLHTVETTVTKLNLRKTLKDQNLISFSQEPLESLYKLCKSSGIDLPEFNELPAGGKKLEDKSTQQAEPQWAFLEDCDYNQVYLCCVLHPTLFYVRLRKFYDLFENLQKEIQVAIMQPFYPKNPKVEVGKCYLAKDCGSDDYCRVKIVEINNDIAECFYVDFGDSATINVADIKHLADQLIVKLPFQAIECRLYGIQPAWGGDVWEETAINILEDYILEPGTDYFRSFYTRTCKQEAATATGSLKYAILLLDNFKKNRTILLNQLLIDCGEAVNVNGEELTEDFDIPEPYEEPDNDIPELDGIEDKQLSLEDVQRLASKYKSDNVVDNSETSQEAKINDVNDNDEEENVWDVVINDAETLLKQLMGLKVEEKPEEPGPPELPPMKALEFSSYSTPSVEWFQTDAVISINIMLADLKEHVLKLARNRMLLFKTTYDDKEYRLDLQLYDKVEKTFNCKIYGQYLRVLLTKCTPAEWPRLILSTTRMRHIKYDASRISVPEKKEVPFLTLTGIDDDNNAEDDDSLIDIGSDEDYSESDIESFASD